CFVMLALRFPPGFSYDPVMGFDYGISNRRFPLHNTDGKDRPACRTSVATVRPWADRTALLAAVR
ncbi:hypothetical protein, partial [Klebsiella pneumoniae]|uniref:hypothetical protein n=1 Tax=Klebsiella pneumoniae TaxID=573 RepID=UPI001C562EAA